MSLFTELTSSVNAVRPGRSAMPSFDILLIAFTAALVLFGLLMVYSASIALADGPRYEHYGRYYFVIRHSLFLLVGLLAMGFVLNIPMAIWQKLAIPLFVLGLILLLLVLIPGIGREVNGARRWITFGPLNLQPSEMMKIAVLLYAADYVVRKQDYMQTFVRGFLPMAVALMLVGGLVLVEPDLGAFIVIVAIALGVVFIGGINARLVGSLMSFLLVSFALLIWFSPWRRGRIFAYLDPWNPEHMYGSAYQLSHSLIALGRGEWFGVGLGASIEKLHYLPEAHTDFIVAVIGEELGVVGIVCLLLAFLVLIWRGFDIGRQAIAMDRVFSGLVAQGIALWLGVQVFINVGVVVGLLPTKGLTLPLISYGGSGVVMNLVAMALLLRVDFENRNLMRGKRT